MSRFSPADGVRHVRIQQLILDELQTLFRDDIDDPALADLHILTLVLASDLRSARVHYAVPRAQAQGAARALVRATPFLRANLAHTLELKRVPELRFVLDASFDGDAPALENEP